MSPGRHVRTRLYFTSESHVHSLLSIFRYGGLLDVSNPTPVLRAFLNVFQMRVKVEPEFLFVWQEEKDQQWKRAMDYLSAVSELNYMTQIVIMLYEDNNKVEFSWFIFVIRCHFLCEFLECELGNFIENKK